MTEDATLTSEASAATESAATATENTEVVREKGGEKVGEPIMISLRKDCTMDGSLATDLVQISESFADEEQHTPKAEDCICKVCCLPIQPFEVTTMRCLCEPGGDLDQHIDSQERTPGAGSSTDCLLPAKKITLEVREKIRSECKECKSCGGHANKVCQWTVHCPMHAKIQKEKDPIDQIIEDWTRMGRSTAPGATQIPEGPLHQVASENIGGRMDREPTRRSRPISGGVR